MQAFLQQAWEGDITAAAEALAKQALLLGKAAQPSVPSLEALQAAVLPAQVDGLADATGPAPADAAVAEDHADRNSKVFVSNPKAPDMPFVPTAQPAVPTDPVVLGKGATAAESDVVGGTGAANISTAAESDVMAVDSGLTGQAQDINLTATSRGHLPARASPTPEATTISNDRSLPAAVFQAEEAPSSSSLPLAAEPMQQPPPLRISDSAPVAAPLKEAEQGSMQKTKKRLKRKMSNETIEAKNRCSTLQEAVCASMHPAGTMYMQSN